jgi:hypothetical protein
VRTPSPAAAPGSSDLGAPHSAVVAGTFNTSAVMSSWWRPFSEKARTSSKRKSRASSAVFRRHAFQISASFPQLRSSSFSFPISCSPSVANSTVSPGSKSHRETCRKGSRLRQVAGSLLRRRAVAREARGSKTPVRRKPDRKERKAWNCTGRDRTHSHALIEERQDRGRILTRFVDSANCAHHQRSI